MRSTIISLTFILTLTSYAAVRSRIEILYDKQAKSLERLLKTTSKNDPRIEYKILVLELKKAKHIRDIETKNYLTLTKSERKSARSKALGSKKYFKRYFEKAGSFLRKYPNYHLKNNILYNLGFYHIEIGKPRLGEKFFKKSLVKMDKKDLLWEKTVLALAEISFTKKRYIGAAKLYERVLRANGKREYLFVNLAKCYYLSGQRNKLVDLGDRYLAIKREHSISKEIVPFLVIAHLQKNTLEKFIKILKSKSIAFVSALSAAGDIFNSRKQFSTASKLYDVALINATGSTEKNQLMFKRLRLHEKYGNDSKHYLMVKNLLKVLRKSNDKSMLEDVLLNINRRVATIHKRLVKGDFKGLSKLKNKKISSAIEYYNLLLTFGLKKDYAQIFFYRGELYSHITNSKKALESYVKAFEYLDSDTKLREMILSESYDEVKDAGNKISTSMKEKIYSLYTQYSKDRKRKAFAYSELFNISITKKEAKSAAEIFVKSKGIIRLKSKVYSQMALALLALYSEKKEHIKFLKLAKDIDSKGMVISSENRKRLEKYKMNILFNSVEKDYSNGEIGKAVAGYLEVSDATKYGVDVAANASFNLAVLYSEYGHLDKSYLWAQKSLRLLSKKKMLTQFGSFIQIAQKLFTYQKISKALKISSNILNRMCHIKLAKKDTLFKNLILMGIASKQEIDIKKAIVNNRKCHLESESLTFANGHLVNYYVENKKWEKALIFEKNSEKSFVFLPLYDALRKYYRTSKNMKKEKEFENKLLQLFKDRHLNLKTMDQQHLSILAGYYQEILERTIEKVFVSKIEFPEDRFDSILSQKFSGISEVQKKVSDITKLDYGKGSLKAYLSLSKFYTRLIDEIEGFIPRKRSNEYIKSFKIELSKIALPLKEKRSKYLNDIENTQKKYDILLEEMTIEVPDEYFTAMNREGMI
ncbi:hypothetical protein OAB57_00795 [Bacteriovoracaceae bacterium]|nr:hypothetical protein [Bacteriovoracaceae bacterium]